VTVLTGSYGNNFGEKFEPKGEMMKPGSLVPTIAGVECKRSSITNESGQQGLARSWKTPLPVS
jgi:hypothetical protein